ncbi:MAG: UvrD-helicase domain-containing protein [Rhizobiales bacterium]|nr:UvrD-helicase domain-containing protein [Hyphomicrobiales bacterium]
MSQIKPENWVPVGVENLESNAWRALRSDTNLSVVAGPGAGKTEFLAQKATYLLQTGICPDPFQILAISFKRDAAANLTERVKKRCPPEQAIRFTSITFDAFTKSLVDRFQSALPDEWKPSSPYEITFPKARDFEEALRSSRFNAPVDAWVQDIVAINRGTFEANLVGCTRLPFERFVPRTGRDFAVSNWWSLNLTNKTPSELSFVMLNRLAELLLRFRPDILSAIRQTYSYVFVDEFQDTTFSQYDFLKTLFHGSQTKITTVGDDKQKIMGWAGAVDDAFQQFEYDYGAERIPLLFNFRSSPALVQVQHVIANAMDEGIEEVEAQAAMEIDGQAAQIWTFSNKQAEISQIATWLSDDMQARGKSPRDYAVIVRQKADEFEGEIMETFLNNGLKVRNEARMIGAIGLQDLIGEELVTIFCAMMWVLVKDRQPKSWKVIENAYLVTQGIDIENENSIRKCEDRLEAFIKSKKEDIIALNVDAQNANDLCLDIINFFGKDMLSQAYHQYSMGDLLDLYSESLKLRILC